jgi:hypothetical protein
MESFLERIVCVCVCVCVHVRVGGCVGGGFDKYSTIFTQTQGDSQPPR